MPMIPFIQLVKPQTGSKTYRCHYTSRNNLHMTLLNPLTMSYVFGTEIEDSESSSKGYI